MRRLVTLLLGLMVALSFGTTSLAHALEPIGCVDAAEATLLGHSANDADQVPTDNDKGYPHHHGGCPGHIVGVPVTDSDASFLAGQPAIGLPRPAPVLHAITAQALQRPPRA